MSAIKPGELRIPIVQAPLAGGASTPQLAAAVADAGGLGFLAAGYKTAEALREDITELRSLTSGPFGVNIFAPPAQAADDLTVQAYAEQLRAESQRYGVELGDARHDDDEFEPKLAVVLDERVEIVSFTFGCPPSEMVAQLHDGGCDVWVTVTSPDEAVRARAAGADVLVAQGLEAGGHRGYFVDGPDAQDIGLIALLRLIAARVELPLVAAGGIADGEAVAAVLCAGASAAQIGTALMLAPEAGTAEAHRAALRGHGLTGLTRAFSGRQARGIVNRFMREHSDRAPIAYPQIHHLTSPVRAAARERGDPGGVNLWAGQAYELAREAPAGEIVTALAAQARGAVAAVAQRLG